MMMFQLAIIENLPKIRRWDSKPLRRRRLLLVHHAPLPAASPGAVDHIATVIDTVFHREQRNGNGRTPRCHCTCWARWQAATGCRCIPPRPCSSAPGCCGPLLDDGTAQQRPRLRRPRHGRGRWTRVRAALCPCSRRHATVTRYAALFYAHHYTLHCHMSHVTFPEARAARC